MKSIAEALGLHVSTVSRVLNGDPRDAGKAASPEVVERIRAFAAQRDYRADVQASALKTRRTREISVLMPRLSDLVMATIYEGIDDAAATAGYLAFVANTLDDPERQRARADEALRRRVAGLVIGDAHIGEDQPLLDELRRRDVPFVLVSRAQASYPGVSCDDELGGRMVARHLFERGHRRVAVLAGEKHASTGADRTRGFLTFYREQGIELDAGSVLHGHFDTHAGRELGSRLMRGRVAPEAIFAVNDFLAIGAMGVARDCGLRIGRDVAIVGYNDTPLAAELPIPLTSVRLPMFEMGGLAVELLLEQLAGAAPRAVLLAPALQVRESSSP
ncbi:LacI family DNA-binding transcriptional regulator [Burkholderia sp. 3C]